MCSVSEDAQVRGYGIDRISVSFLLDSFESDRSFWSLSSQIYSQRGPSARELVGEKFQSKVELADGVEAFVGVQVIYDASPHAPVWGKVEFNPSRVVDPDGCSLASVDVVVGCLGQVMIAAAGLVRPVDGDVSNFRTKRVDVARDFECVEASSALIRGLGSVHRPYSRRNMVFADPKHNGAQTLFVGSGAGGARLYDKHAETSGKAPEGTLRVEFESRSEWLKNYGGISTVADLSELNVGRLAVDRWEWSAMGAEVASTVGVVEVVIRSDFGLSDREKTMFIGWLVRQSTPHAFEPGSSATLAKFRRLQRELGIAVGPEALSSVGFVSRLDWETGKEVVRVA